MLTSSLLYAEHQIRSGCLNLFYLNWGLIAMKVLPSAALEETLFLERIYFRYMKLTYLLHGAESFLRSYLVLQLVKKFPAFFGTRRFITVLTSARHLSLS